MSPCNFYTSQFRALILVGAFLTHGCGGGGGSGGSGDSPPPRPPEPMADVTLSLAEGVTELDEWQDSTSVEVTVTLSQAVNGEVRVTLGSSGSATLGGDFDLSEMEVRVAQGNTSATSLITPIRDFEEENDETISVEIASVAGNGQAGTSSSVSLSLIDQGGLFVGAKENIYARLYALFSDPLIYENRIDFYAVVLNVGAVPTSDTGMEFWVSTLKNLSRLACRPDCIESALVPSIMPGYSIRLPFSVPLSSLPGQRPYYALISVSPAEEEGPDARARQDFAGVAINSSGRAQVTCPDFERNTSPGTEDPLKDAQWSLENTGQAAYAANAGVEGEDLGMTDTLSGGPTGAGVKVAVSDTGLEICHPDLEANIEAGASFNFNRAYWSGASSTDPFLPSVYGDHGTSVAGIIAAESDNGIGGRGVAPSALLRGYNFLSAVDSNAGYFGSLGGSDSQPNSTDVDIFNMSFGIFGGEYNSTRDEIDLFGNGVRDLRSGRGALYVKAGGNGFGRCDSMRRIDEVLVGEEDRDGDGTLEPVFASFDINDEIGCVSVGSDPSNNLPYVISVGAFSANGERSSYSSAGSGLWISTPAGEYGAEFPAQVTTDQMGSEQGYDALFEGLVNGRGIRSGDSENPHGDYISTFNGTSAAAPNASGAIALLLEAQPELTWRDVKYILARTARQIHPDIAELKIGFGGSAAVLRHGWITNAAGYHFHNWYGFGAISVDDAIEIARTHTPDSLGTFSDGRHVFNSVESASIPDHSGAGVTQTLNVSGIDAGLEVEAVQLHIEVTHPFTNDLGVYLISPSGTESLLNPPFNEVLTGDVNLDWTLLSNAFYGESPSGDWTLKVIDAAEGDTGTLDAWQLTFYLGDIPPRE